MLAKLIEKMRCPAMRDLLGSRQDLTVQDREPPLRLLAPLAPGVGQQLETDLVGKPVLDGLGGEVRRHRPVRPQAGPPRAVLGRRVAPHPRARHDASGVEPRLPYPGEQPTTGVRL